MFKQLRMFVICINVFRTTETICVCQLYHAPITCRKKYTLLLVDEIYVVSDVVTCDCLKILGKTGNYVAGSSYSWLIIPRVLTAVSCRPVRTNDALKSPPFRDVVN
jgi:hypothetical protein